MFLWIGYSFSAPQGAVFLYQKTRGGKKYFAGE